MTDPYSSESIILRVAELQEGRIQFTDTTNAKRLYREFGSEIRYNSAWRKWLVFNGQRWVVDDGALIQERGLRMVRGIYNDLLKTNDYRIFQAYIKAKPVLPPASRASSLLLIFC